MWGRSGQRDHLHRSDPTLDSRQPYRNVGGDCGGLPFDDDDDDVSLLLLLGTVLAGFHSQYRLISPPTSTFSSTPSS